MSDRRTIRKDEARLAAARRLRAFVNTRVQERNPITTLHDAEALAVVDAITAAVVQGIEELLAEPPHDGTHG